MSEAIIAVGSEHYRGKIVEWHGNRYVTIEVGTNRFRGKMVPMQSEPYTKSVKEWDN